MKKSLSLSPLALCAAFLASALFNPSCLASDKVEAPSVPKTQHFSHFSKGLKNIKNRLGIVKKRREFELKRKNKGVKMKLIARNLPNIKWTKNETPNLRTTRDLKTKLKSENSRFKDVIRYSKK